MLFVVASICFTLVHSFLLNLNDSHLGFGNDNQDHLSRRIDNFQAQIQLQIKTLESQSALIQQLLNYPISTLSSRYSTLSTLLQEIESRVITLEHNLEDIRLTNGNYSGEGRLKVKYQGSWGTVCDNSFADQSAKVVCRQLEYQTSRATTVLLPLVEARAILFLTMSSAPVSKVQLLFVVIMDLDKTIADTMKTLESFVLTYDWSGGNRKERGEWW